MDALNELDKVDAALSKVPFTVQQLLKAQTPLANARDAFFVVETSLSYADPSDAKELAALPSKLAPMLSSPGMSAFHAVETALASRIEGETASASDAEIQKDIRALRQDLKTVADAWSGNDLGNFRNKFFLADPNADARIFRGLLATSEVLVHVSNNGSPQEILSRLRALNDHLTGAYENSQGVHQSGPSPLDLLSQSDPNSADALTKILQALLDTLENAPPLPSSPSFEQLRDTLRSGLAPTSQGAGPEDAKPSDF
jgi:hypothetical protein